MKRKNTTPAPKADKATAQKTATSSIKTPWLQSGDHIPFLLLCLYAAVDIVPRGESTDIMGSQWLFLSIINIAALFYVTRKKTNNDSAWILIPRQLQTILYVCLLVITGLSAISAINQTEWLVNYARFINTFFMYFCMALLLCTRLHLLKALSQLLTLLLFFQALDILLKFTGQLDESDLNTIIFNLKGNAGNKNILAASLELKIPFAVYCILTIQGWKKYASAFILALGTLALFILNARATYIGVSLQLLILVAGISWLEYKAGNKNILSKLGYTVVPILLAFGLVQLIIGQALRMEQNQSAVYGTVVSRLGTISATVEGSNARLQHWSTAVDYIKKHPLTGSGYGNWKLASIPYEKYYVNDFYLTNHVHNDFLEITAESGLPGGILYMGLFVVLLFYLLSTLFKARPYQDKILALVGLMLLAGYFTDAFFNFPMERPVMQFFFALMLAFGVNVYLSSKFTNTASLKPVITKTTGLIIGMAFMITALYVTYQTYRSYTVQSLVNRDMMMPEPQTRYEDIDGKFPSLPNMNIYGFPIDYIKGYYLMREKRYDEALGWLTRASRVNPHLTVADYLKAKIYFDQNKVDSSRHYAEKAFANKPRARSNYEMLNDVGIVTKDTSLLTRGFKEYIKLRNEAWAWNRYLDIMIYFNHPREKLQALTTEAVRLFPDDANLLQKHANLGGSVAAAPQDPNYLQYFNAGLEAYNKADYNTAAASFVKASSANLSDHLSLENAGLSYYYLKDYNSALKYLDASIQLNKSTDGKVQFLKGMCLVGLGKNAEACPFLKIAQARNYPEASKMVATYCK